VLCFLFKEIGTRVAFLSLFSLSLIVNRDSVSRARACFFFSCILSSLGSPLEFLDFLFSFFSLVCSVAMLDCGCGQTAGTVPLISNRAPASLSPHFSLCVLPQSGFLFFLHRVRISFDLFSNKPIARSHCIQLALNAHIALLPALAALLLDRCWPRRDNPGRENEERKKIKKKKKKKQRFLCGRGSGEIST
jgi:hypothetical protein